MNDLMCPHCAGGVEWAADQAGLDVRCPQCGGVFRMPATAPAAASQPASGGAFLVTEGPSRERHGYQRRRPGFQFTGGHFAIMAAVAIVAGAIGFVAGREEMKYEVRQKAEMIIRGMDRALQELE